MNSLKFSIVKDLRFGLDKPKIEISIFKYYLHTFIVIYTKLIYNLVISVISGIT